MCVCIYIPGSGVQDISRQACCCPQPTAPPAYVSIRHHTSAYVRIKTSPGKRVVVLSQLLHLRRSTDSCALSPGGGILWGASSCLYADVC